MEKNSSTETIKDIFWLFFIATLLLGVLFLVAAALVFAHAEPGKIDILWSGCLSLGINLISAAGLTYFLETKAHNAKILAQNELTRVLQSELSRFLAAELKPIITDSSEELRRLRIVTRREFSVTRSEQSEFARAIYTDQIKRDVFNGGICAAFTAWVSRIDTAFFSTQSELNIILKDGKTFFNEKIGLLESRAKRGQFTRILIIHPDFEHMAALAAMDYNKSGKLELQRSDCLEAVREMHALRTRLLAAGSRCEELIVFIGYHRIPTWNGFLGDASGYVHLYFTRPHRGELNTLFMKLPEHDQETSWLRSYSNDFGEIIRDAQSYDMNAAADKGSNLWRYGL